VDAYTIIITPNAEEDLRNIRNYIALVLSVPDVALQYIQSIRKEIEKLSYLAKSIVYIMAVIYARREQLKALEHFAFEE